MNRLSRTIMLLCLLALTSCESKQDKAREIVEKFAAAATDASGKAELAKYYPSINDFRLLISLEDLSIDSCHAENDLITVHCTIGYHDETGSFRQDKACFNVAKDEKGDYIITASKNLIHMPDDVRKFAQLTGAVNNVTTDAQLASRAYNINQMFDEYLQKYQDRLNNSIEVKGFSWNSDWGTPNGRATIRNTLPFDLYGVKYHIEYTSRGNVVGTDDGIAASTLKAGERKTFSFYSSGVPSNAHYAQITFSLPQKAALAWMLNDVGYTGSEFRYWQQ